MPVLWLQLVLAQTGLLFLLIGMQFVILALQLLHHDLGCYSLVVFHSLLVIHHVPFSYELAGLQSSDLVLHE